MTVENTNSTISYTGNSSVTTFAYNFLTYSTEHLFIYFDDVLQTSGFTITGIGDDNGGDVTFVSPPTTGVTIRIDRTVPDTQLLAYQEYGPFPAKANERGLDLLTMAVQQTARNFNRGKMDKRPLAAEDNIIVFDDTGNSKDSGFPVFDGEAKMDRIPNAGIGNFVTFDSNGNSANSGINTTSFFNKMDKAPTSNIDNVVIFDSAGNAKDSGKKLNEVGNGGSYIGENPPTFPQQGDRWTRCTDMKGFIYYIDADSAQWVEDRPSYGDDTIGDVSIPYIFDTVADYQASTIVFPVGKTIHLNDRQADFTVIAGTGTGNDKDIISSTPVNQSIQMTAPFTMQKLGSLNDGTDDTARATRLNELTKVMVFDAGKLFTLQNFVPIAGTRMLAKGAKINKLNNTPYIAASSAAIIFENDDLLLEGGVHGDNDASVSFSGSILIYKGNNQRITGAKFIESWGGIVGLEDINGADFATDVTIDHCVLDGCFHNTYLADIHGLTFTDNHSKNANRDGFRTYRNIINQIITGNHIYDNGDGTLGQSQDGMDLFIAGKKCIITGNFIHGNFFKGIDIKKSTGGEVEANVDRQYIIAHNFIYNNGDSGIELESSDAGQPDIPLTNISNNEIYNNTARGIFVSDATDVRIVDNDVYDNGSDGIRCDKITNMCQVRGNQVYQNTGVGILIVSTVASATCKDNRVYQGSTATQSIGISFGPTDGICKDNTVTGHPTNVTTTVLTGLVGGRTESASLNDTAQSLIQAPIEGEVSYISLIAAATATFSVTISKRDEVTGNSDGVLFTGNINFTAYVPVIVALTGGVAIRQMKSGQGLLIDATAGTFTFASIKVGFVS